MIEKAQNSNDYEDYFAVAQEYFNEGKYDDARNFIQDKLFIKFPENVRNYCLFAKTHNRLRRRRNCKRFKLRRKNKLVF